MILGRTTIKGALSELWLGETLSGLATIKTVCSRDVIELSQLSLGDFVPIKSPSLESNRYSRLQTSRSLLM